MLEAPKVPKNHYQKKLEEIARLGNYQAVASIPQVSHDFNFTFKQPRYGCEESQQMISKRKVNLSYDQKNQNIKLKTILETSSPHKLFPKIMRKRPDANSPKNKHHKLRSHFTRQTTARSLENSLTIDTRLDTQSELGQLSQVDRDMESRWMSRERQKSYLSSQLGKASRVGNILESIQMKQQPEVEETSNSDDSEYQKQACPGPGTYSFSYSDFDKKNNSRRSTAVSFISKSSRFPSISQNTINDRQPLETVNEEEEKPKIKASPRPRKQKLIPFGSKSPHRYEYQQLSKDTKLGPQYYSPRKGLQQDLIRRIQRNFKGSFGSNADRFKKKDDSESAHLGPGVYHKQEIAEQQPESDYYFKSVCRRFE